MMEKPESSAALCDWMPRTREATFWSPLPCREKGISHSSLSSSSPSLPLRQSSICLTMSWLRTSPRLRTVSSSWSRPISLVVLSIRLMISVARLSESSFTIGVSACRNSFAHLVRQALISPIALERRELYCSLHSARGSRLEARKRAPIHSFIGMFRVPHSFPSSFRTRWAVSTYPSAFSNVAIILRRMLFSICSAPSTSSTLRNFLFLLSQVTVLSDSLHSSDLSSVMISRRAHLLPSSAHRSRPHPIKSSISIGCSVLLRKKSTWLRTSLRHHWMLGFKTRSIANRIVDFPTLLGPIRKLRPGWREMSADWIPLKFLTLTFLIYMSRPLLVPTTYRHMWNPAFWYSSWHGSIWT